MTKLPDPADVSSIIQEVVATEILPRFRRLDQDEVREKGPGDLVTIADEAAERALERRLCDLVPGSVVVGEEGVAARPDLLGRVGEDAPVWIIDPVDGTSNFVRGDRHFSCVVALAFSGQTRMGWIHDCLNNKTAWGCLGEGAWLDDARLSAAPPDRTEDMSGALAPRFFSKDLRRHLETRLDRIGRTFTLHSASQEYLQLLTGSSHFSVYRRIMPWDHAAGTLLHSEAGGYHAKLDGGRYAPTDTAGGLLLAPDRNSWLALRDLLFGD